MNMSNELEKYHDIGKKIENFLRPSTFPIAIKLIRKEDEIPEGSKRPNATLKIQTFLCQNFSMVRRYGWTMAVMEEDCVCKVARMIYGWETITDESAKFGSEFSTGLYAKDPETANKWSAQLHFAKRKYKGVVISPLSTTKIIPDVVQVYGNPAQIMRLIHAYLYSKGGTLEFTASGRGGSCQEGVTKTFNTDEPQLVILGNGDRVWGGAEDSEIMFSIPESKLDVIVEGLKTTHEAGLRYPIPKYMNYRPGFQDAFEKRAKKRAGGTLVKENK